MNANLVRCFVLSAALPLALAACGDDASGEGGGNLAAKEVTLEITLMDRTTSQPLPGGLLSIEVGGIYVENPDTSKGSPAYQLGGQADDQGRLTVTVPAGTIGLHSFAGGYRYGRMKEEVASDTALVLGAAEQLPEDVPPTIQDARLDPARVSPGGSVTVSCMAAASSTDDPLSDETLAILDRGNFSVALDPPSAGVQGVGFPDGAYEASFSAPSEPGTYTVFVVTTSEMCITSEPVALELVVE